MIEVAYVDGMIQLRDSRNPRQALTYTSAYWVSEILGPIAAGFIPWCVTPCGGSVVIDDLGGVFTSLALRVDRADWDAFAERAVAGEYDPARLIDRKEAA